jgi:hypothetical protein
MIKHRSFALDVIFPVYPQILDFYAGGFIGSK